MANDVKRLKYFKGQFLRENDFLDEQTYHVQHQRDHARTMHTPGIALGLDVPTPAPGATAVTVQAGIGYDDQGRRIVLVDNLLLELATFTAGQPVYVTITYDEQPTDPTSDTGITGSTRFTEKPIVAGSLTPPANPNAQLVLAKVIRTGGTVTSIDATGRVNASVKANDLLVSSLTVSSKTEVPANWPSVRTTGPLQATLTGSLQVNGTLGATTLAANMVNTAQIVDAAVNNAKLASNSVTTAKVLDANITTLKLADAAVTTAKIATAAVTTAQIAAGAVQTAQIAAGAVQTAQLVDNSVVAAKIAAGAVTTAQIAAGAVQTAQIAAGAVQTTQIAPGAVQTNQIAAGAVTTAQIAAGAVQTAQIAAGAVQTNQIAAGAVQTNQLADNSVVAAKIVDGAVGAAELANLSIPFAKLNVTVTDFPFNTIAASGTTPLAFTPFTPPAAATGGLWFVDAWGLSANASFSWTIGGTTTASSPPAVTTVIRFTNLTTSTMQFAAKVYRFTPA